MTTIIKTITLSLTFFILLSGTQGIANAQNLLNNPGFENNTNGWSSNASTIASSSTSYAGKTSAIVINRDANSAGPGQDITNALRNSGKGKYNLQAYIKLASGTGKGRVTVSLYDDTGRNYHNVSNSINAENFSKVSGNVNLNWSGSLYSARLHIETGRETTTAMFVDDITLSPERPPGTTVFYSYQSDFSNPKLLKDATLEPRQTYFFITDKDQYKKVNFYCCKGFTDIAAGAPHAPVVSDLTAPFGFFRNTTNMASGIRELYFDSFSIEGGVESHAVNFKLGKKILASSQNTPPVISGSPAKRVTENSPYTFQPSVKNIGNNTLTFSISGQPGWAIFDNNTGRLSGIPIKGERGSYNNIIISVTDGIDTIHLPAFNIQIEPLVTKTQTTNIKAYYSYNKNLSNAKSLEGAVLQPRQTYFFISKNDKYKKIVFYCCKGHTGDAAGKSHLPAIVDNVVDNNAPYNFTLNTSGMASGIRELYFDSFPTAGDTESHKVYFNLSENQSKQNANSTSNSTLKTSEQPTNNTTNNTTNTTAFYSYQNDLSNPQLLDGAILKPRQTYFFITDNGQYKATTFYCCKGLSGDAAGESHSPSVIDLTSPYHFSQNTTGMLPGTRELYFDTFPTTGGIENHSVKFSVAGDPSQKGKFTIRWTAPSARTDGSALALSEIAGYTVYYGRSKGKYSSHIKVNDHSAISKTVQHISTGTYYVVVTTRDAGGRESSYSKEAVINVP